MSKDLPFRNSIHLDGRRLECDVDTRLLNAAILPEQKILFGISDISFRHIRYIRLSPSNFRAQTCDYLSGNAMKAVVGCTRTPIRQNDFQGPAVLVQLDARDGFGEVRR
jgi:hypothetical protein